MKKVKQIRKLCKIRQFEMAKLLDMDQSNYCNIENGRYLFKSIPKIEKKALDILYPKFISLVASKEKELMELKQVLIENY